jgi:hypothetical protein
LRKVAKPALAGLLAVLVIVIAAFSVSPSLHRFLHSKAAGADHFCAVCFFATGQVNAADGALALAASVLMFLLCAAWSLTFAQPARDFRLSPSRAPPGLSFVF